MAVSLARQRVVASDMTPGSCAYAGREGRQRGSETERRYDAFFYALPCSNLQVPKSGETLVAATQDFLTCAYLLTRRDAFFTRSEFAQLCSYMGDGMDR